MDDAVHPAGRLGQGPALPAADLTNVFVTDGVRHVRLRRAGRQEVVDPALPKVGEGTWAAPRAARRRPPQPAHVVTYIVRRLIAAVVLLLDRHARSRSRSSSWCPRLAGATADDLASRYVGKTAGRGDDPRDRGHSSASPTRLRPVRALREGHRRRRGLQHRPERRALPGAVPRLLVHQPDTRCWPDLLDRLPVTLSLAARRGGDLAGRRRRRRRALGAATRQRLRPGGDGRRAGRRLAADLLHRPARRCRLQLRAGLVTAPAAATRRSPRTRQWAYDLILPWVTLAFLYAAPYARLTRAGMLETMSEDYIRTARAKGLQRAHGRRQARRCARRSPRSSRSSAWTSGCCSAARCSPRARSRLPRHRQVRGRRDRRPTTCRGARA